MAGGVVIIGAGQAGCQVATSLREGGYNGLVTLIGDEPASPYQRPPLSKTYIVGSPERSSLQLKRPSFYSDKSIELRTETRVTGIERAAKRVNLSSGENLPYDTLVLATGTRNWHLGVPGIELKGVHGLRGVEDAEALREALNQCTSLAVVGGGFIGLEVAALAKKLGKPVTVLETASRLVSRVCRPETSEAILSHHLSIGVDVQLNATVARIEGRGGIARGVSLATGYRIAADLILVCVGVVPNSELAKSSGLRVGNGISVDSALKTSDPDVFAIGDCAHFPCPYHGSTVRLESVPNAVEQGKHVARVILGNSSKYRSLPWFWSDQGTLKLQMAGVTTRAEASVAIKRPQGQALYCFAGGNLIGVECLNSPADFVQVRKALSEGRVVSYAQLEAVDFDLRTLSQAAA